MADQKITELTATTTLAGTDILPVVTDPSGTPTNKKITVTNLKTAMSQLALTDIIYFGDSGTNGSFRIRVNAGELLIEKRVSGSWVELAAFIES